MNKKGVEGLPLKYVIIAIAAAGSGHTGGTMSIIDIAVALYFKKINRYKNPCKEELCTPERILKKGENRKAKKTEKRN